MSSVKLTVKLAAPVSRADLLKSLILAGEDGLNSAAELLGYQATIAKINRDERTNLLSTEKNRNETLQTQQEDPENTTDSGIHYYRITERKPSDLLPDSTSAERDFPDWYYEIPALEVDSVVAETIAPPEKEPLAPWSKLWPILQALVSETRRSRQVDIKRLVNQLAKAEIPVKIPRQLRNSWVAGLQIVVERSDRTQLFNHDYNQLLFQLQKLRGNTGIQIQQLAQRPGGPVTINRGGHYQNQAWRLPELRSQILILSDLGLLDQSGQTLQDWLRFGRSLRLAGFMPVVLMPLPQRYLIPELLTLFTCICWTRHSSLRPVRSIPVARQCFDHPKAVLAQDKIHALDLLAWLSPVVRVEPALLRAITYRLPAPYNDSGVETAAWLHENVEATSIGFYFKPQQLAGFRKQFRKLAIKEPLRTKAIVEQLRRYHRHVFPTQLHEEMVTLATLLGDQLDPIYRKEVEAASIHGKQLLKALVEKPSGTVGLAAFTAYASERQDLEVYTHPLTQYWPAMLGVLTREQGLLPNTNVLNQMAASPESLRTFLAFSIENAVKQDYALFQQGSKALNASTLNRFRTGDQHGFSEGSLLLELSVTTNFGLQQKQNDAGSWDTLLLPLNDQDIHTFTFKASEKQHFHLAGEELTLERFVKPDWAISIGRDHDVLTIATKSADKRHTWYWHPPALGTISDLLNTTAAETWQTHPGFWFYLPPNQDLKPDWAHAAGRDRYGLYAEASIAGIVQRFRWIQPGSFLMGSPQNEEGRYDDETQHQVNLSQGYWLADTACTQALWQEVMRKKPSQFKGENRPVENVSWDDVQTFLSRLNAKQPSLALRLPTEAEWEYACRADTTGAFNFDGELTLDKANYRGTWEYESDKWGDGALQQTAEVKRYPANAWGLYEMHGNVWEWCLDWYGEYPTETVTDPHGPEAGVYRVLRGGSWFNDGRHCRSALRIIDWPGFAVNLIGFRLARGHELSQSGAGQQPVGTRASAARGAQAGDGLPAAKTGGKKPKGIFDKAKDIFKK